MSREKECMYECKPIRAAYHGTTCKRKTKTSASICLPALVTSSEEEEECCGSESSCSPVLLGPVVC